MELAAAVAVSRPAVLTPDRPLPGEHERIRIDVDQPAKAGVRNRAVVTLEVVLDGDLPVRGERILRPLAKDERVRVDRRREPTERLLERRRGGVGVDEQERAPSLELERQQRQPGTLERLAVRPWRRPELPAEAVRPGVVRTLERLPPTGAGDDLRAPVPTHVQEGTQLAVGVADDPT